MFLRPLAAALSATVCLTTLSSGMAQNPITPQVKVNWPEFLGRHDMIWEELPRQWNEGAFLGNGQVGMMVYASLTDNRIDFHIGRQDVTDHRQAPDRKTSRGVPGATVMYDFPRLDIGRMALRPVGKIQSGTLRLDLLNAELTGTIVTDLGELKIRAFTPRDRMVNVVEITSTEKSTDGKPAAYRWDFLPGNATSPRAQVFPDHPQSKEYELNPPPELFTKDGIEVCVQPLLAGGDYATAWKELPGVGKEAGKLVVAIANEVPASGKSAGVAIADVTSAADAKPDTLFPDHRAWWHAFYQRSFLSIPDARQESFFWIQLYKMASASRPDGPAVDLFGPFFRVSQWPGLWWNLNVQLTYWPVYASNHLALGENLIHEMDANFEGLLAGFCNKPILGDFAWTLHNYWWQYRFAGDWKAISEKWVPKALAVLECYRSFLKENADGQLELAPMGSPEYHGFKTYPNTTYNLALLRWLLNSLIEADKHGTSPSPAVAEWQQMLEKLIPYPVDENGLMIAGNQPVDMSHRHYSHLLGLYPLYQLDPDSPEDRDLVVKSVVHWHKIDNGKELTGYSYTGAVSLYASLGMGNEANQLMQQFLTGSIGISQLLSNTMYVESGGRNPVIETPLSAASATMDMLIQSWGDKIRVFPAVPDEWDQASFHQLRAVGGFLVSSVREAGKTRWVYVTSEAGEPCVVKVRDWSGPVQTSAARKITAKEIAPGEYALDLKKGESVLLSPGTARVVPIIEPVAQPAGETNIYGVKMGGALKGNQSWPERPGPEPIRR